MCPFWRLDFWAASWIFGNKFVRLLSSIIAAQKWQQCCCIVHHASWHCDQMLLFCQVFIGLSVTQPYSVKANLRAVGFPYKPGLLTGMLKCTGAPPPPSNPFFPKQWNSVAEVSHLISIFPLRRLCRQWNLFEHSSPFLTYWGPNTGVLISLSPTRKKTSYIHRILWNWEVHYHIHNSPPPLPTLAKSIHSSAHHTFDRSRLFPSWSGWGLISTRYFPQHYSQTSSPYVPPSIWAPKFHTHTKQEAKL